MALRQKRKHGIYVSVKSWIITLLWSLDPVISCGETFSARKGEIKTPNYPDVYDNNLNCTWTVHVNKHETIMVEFLSFDVETSYRGGCKDHFRIYDGPDISSSTVLLNGCGDVIPEPVFSSGNTLTINFLTNSYWREKGVYLAWKVSDKFTLNPKPSTWRDANAHCISNGGHLAAEHDLKDPNLIKVTEATSERLWYGEYYTSWVWLKGCYKDENRKLVLNKTFQESKENEAKVCQYICKDSVYFGLQNMACFCLTAEDLEKLEFVESRSECAIRCYGNNAERCGGAFCLTVYMNDVCWKNSSTWTAKISRTISGRTCQLWNSSHPHSHPFRNDSMFPDASVAAALNYCRDPDGKGAPWCYTTDPEVLWQFCDAPPCVGTCWMNPKNYKGHLNVSVSGYKCRAWTDDAPGDNPEFHNPANYPDLSVAEALNYCRSPSGYPALWCYVDSSSMAWDYCGSPPCFAEENVEDTGKLCRTYRAVNGKFLYEEQDCDKVEKFACFADETESRVIGFTQNFDDARSLCRSSYYSMSDYKVWFGLLKGDPESIRFTYYLGNYRFADNIKNKDNVATPSACKTMRRQDKLMETEIQPDCGLQLGFVCKKEAVLCGKNYDADDGNLTWPVDPGEYENDNYCVWEITVSEGRSISITFRYVDIEESDDGLCSFDAVEISDTSTSDFKTLTKLCGQQSNTTISSPSNKIMFKFTSDKSDVGSGFQLEWSSEIIPSPVLPSSTTIKSTQSSITQLSSVSNGHRVPSTFEGLTDTTDSSVKAGAIAGIVVGGLVIVVVGVVLAVLLRRRMMGSRKEEAIELKENIQGNEDRYSSAASQHDLYSKPLPKDKRKAQQEAPARKVPHEPDNNYYHHLASSQGCIPNVPISTNHYGKLQSGDMYDHTTDTTAGCIGEDYSHIDEKKNIQNAENQPYMSMDNGKPKAVPDCIEYEYFVQDVNKPAVAEVNVDSQYLTPTGQDTSPNTYVEKNNRKLSVDETQIDTETYYNVSDTSDNIRAGKVKIAIEGNQKDMVYDNTEMCYNVPDTRDDERSGEDQMAIEETRQDMVYDNLVV